jgi:hypothetical protein
MTKSSERRRGGQRPFKPSATQRSLVRDCAGAGVTQAQIALLIKNENGRPISVELTRHFGQELEEGHLYAAVAMAHVLLQSALAGNVTAQIFWLKSRAGWKENMPQRFAELF